MKTMLLWCGWMMLHAAGTPAGSLGEGFRLVRSSGEITLYQRWIPGTDATPVRQLKAVFQLQATAAAFLSALRDPVLARSWNQGVTQCRIQPAGDDAWLYYVRYDIPWPFNDQDCLLACRLNTRGADTTEVIFGSLEDPHFPVTAAFDRMSHVRGSWLAINGADGRLHVTYLISSDRSRAVPGWVSDPVVHRTLFSSLEALIGLVEHASSPGPASR